MPKNDFELKLQLHADGDVAAGATAQDAGAPAEVNVAADNGGADYTGDTASNDSGAKTYAIEVDPRTKRRKVVMLAGKEPEAAQQDNAVPAQQTEPKPAAPQQAENKPEVPAQQAAAVQQQAPATPLFANPQQQPQMPEPYKNMAEVMDAIRTNTVDARRIPLEFAGQYAQIRNAMLAQQQAAQNAAQITATGQPPLQSQAAARNEFFMKVEQAARENALKAVGITEEELESADYSDDETLRQKAKQFDTALVWQRNSIVESVKQQQQQAYARQQAQRQIYADIDNKVAEYRSSEPEFEGINVLMANLYKTMPYDKASKYADAIGAYQRGNINVQQAQALQEYYDESRKVYYAQKNGLSVMPSPSPAVPRVETPGTGAQQPHYTTVADLRKASNYKDVRSIVGKMVAERQRKNR